MKEHLSTGKDCSDSTVTLTHYYMAELILLKSNWAAQNHDTLPLSFLLPLGRLKKFGPRGPNFLSHPRGSRKEEGQTGRTGGEYPGFEPPSCSLVKSALPYNNGLNSHMHSSHNTCLYCSQDLLAFWGGYWPSVKGT